MADHDCDYCDDGFDSEEEAIRHKLDEHEDELSSHDRDDLKRRLNKVATDDDGGGMDIKQIAVYGLGVVAVIGLLYGLVASGVVSFSTNAGTGGSTASPASDIPQTEATTGPAGSVHQHATFIVEINGQRVDFSQSRYQLASQKVHFEAGNGRRIHKHATGVNVGYALNTLGMGLNGTCLFKDGKKYCAGSGDLRVTINGDQAQPGEAATHVIQDGESIRIAYTS